MDHLNESLILINEFLKPISTIQEIDPTKLNFELLIGNLVHQFRFNQETILSQLNIQNKHSDCLWDFGVIGLALLEKLNNSFIITNSLSLSIKQERDCATLCELIVSFCIHYNLEDDVGLPIEFLSRYGANIRIYRDKIDASTRNIRLSEAIVHLWKIKTTNIDYRLMNRFIYPKSLHSIICSLIQLLYSPNSLSTLKNEKFKKWLEDEIFHETDGAKIVSAIMIAQGRYLF